VIFGGIVQQRRDAHVFVSAIIEHNGSYAHQVRQVGYAAFFAVLITMYLRGKQ
jgi:hypothetical protein